MIFESARLYWQCFTLPCSEFSIIIPGGRASIVDDSDQRIRGVPSVGGKLTPSALLAMARNRARIQSKQRFGGGTAPEWQWAVARAFGAIGRGTGGSV